MWGGIHFYLCPSNFEFFSFHSIFFYILFSDLWKVYVYECMYVYMCVCVFVVDVYVCITVCLQDCDIVENHVSVCLYVCVYVCVCVRMEK